MSQKSLTSDERILLVLYQAAKKAGNPFQAFDLFTIARLASLKKTALKTIVRHLAQANFITKEDHEKIKLTPQGHKFVEEHLH